MFQNIKLVKLRSENLEINYKPLHNFGQLFLNSTSITQIQPCIHHILVARLYIGLIHVNKTGVILLTDTLGVVQS